MNPCSNCGNAPRMVSKNGKELTRCEECQRAYWREHKAGKPHQSPTNQRKQTLAVNRTCKTCGLTKPIEDFPKNGKTYKTICKPCYAAYVNEGKRDKAHAPGIRLDTSVSTVKTASRAVKPSVLFVDRLNGRMVLCEIMSETPITNEATVPHLCQFYDSLGYRVVDVVELMTEGVGR